ncbi:hypothetical protein [Austwickia sp. TVS 96-490-7B]|uniref:hypothetical protein n=1 Tax=Austwickia sp. TVS 96-490-7B TaxID=2830843 RepID=UPI001C5A25B2|nr:hypothetical protein [Austwickia sp. TVS 96-490-7B]
MAGTAGTWRYVVRSSTDLAWPMIIVSSVGLGALVSLVIAVGMAELGGEDASWASAASIGVLWGSAYTVGQGVMMYLSSRATSRHLSGTEYRVGERFVVAVRDSVLVDVDVAEIADLSWYEDGRVLDLTSRGCALVVDRREPASPAQVRCPPIALPGRRRRVRILTELKSACELGR